MKHCATCRFWNTDNARNPLGDTSFTLGRCSLITDSVFELGRNETIALLEIDDTGADLRTGPMFGCIHHEALVNPPQQPSETTPLEPVSAVMTTSEGQRGAGGAINDGKPHPCEDVTDISANQRPSSLVLSHGSAPGIRSRRRTTIASQSSQGMLYRLPTRGLAGDGFRTESLEGYDQDFPIDPLWH